MTSTWILVADTARARLFEPAPSDGRLVEIECFTNPEGRAGARQVDVHPPPTVNQSAAGRHDLERHEGARERTTQRFAHVLSEVLEVRPSKSRPDRGLIKVRTTTFNQNGEPVMVFTGNLLVPRRPAAAASA